MKLRKAAVAGTFYPSDKGDLEKAIQTSFKYWESHSLPSIDPNAKVYGAVVPHAGYQYSGIVAAAVYSKLKKADTVIIIGPNHTGEGPFVSVFPDGYWETPLGQVEVDSEIAKSILSKSQFAQKDERAHQHEHSVEVHLPFLQTIMQGAKVVPIAIMHTSPNERFYSVCKDLGMSIYSAIKSSGKNVLILASTDLTHYELKERAESKDNIAISDIMKLDETGLLKSVSEYRISMCGFGGVTATLIACKALGAKKAEKVAYMTSWNYTGGNSPVVGYGGLIIL
ncbi:MAG: AmmeMemoRadiSam system protein B [Candidatus Altiarchaeota archaeon]|nr:AmmeMemoRadiSam system protein B [Candidatus Altiarchaeota archaeon]